MRGSCLLIGGLTLLPVAGCGVQGRWHLDEASAVGASGVPARLELNRDHSYELLTSGTPVTTERGTWKYCCCREELTLTSSGHARTIKASRACGRLTLDLPEPDGPGQVTLTRCRACDPCPLPNTQPASR